MSRANGTKGQAQFTRRLTFVMLAGLLAASSTYCGKKTEETSYMTNGPKGTFGNGDGKETLDYVKGLRFTDDTAYRASYACDGCSPAGVTLMFLPREHAERIAWPAHLQSGQTGEVVAKVVNVDNATFTDGNFTLAPNDSAYFWVGEVDYNGAPTRGFGVYKLTATGTLAGEWSVRPMTGYIKHCPNPAPRSKPAVRDHHVGPGVCTQIAVAGSTGKTRLASLGISTAYAASAAVASRMFAALGQLWISCSGGCCQVSTI